MLENDEVHPDTVRGDVWWRIGMATVGTVFNWCFRLRYLGLENIPARAAALLASNHVSPLDPIAIALGASETGRTVRFLAGAEFFNRPVIGWGLRAIKQIPIRRGASDRAALEDVATVIRRGALAGIFPEGRVGETGELQRGKRGAARIALASGVPLIPVAIWGTQRRWPRSGIRFNLPVRPPVAVAYGRQIPAEGELGNPADVRALTDRLMDGIAGALDTARAAVA